MDHYIFEGGEWSWTVLLRNYVFLFVQCQFVNVRVCLVLFVCFYLIPIFLLWYSFYTFHFVIGFLCMFFCVIE